MENQEIIQIIKNLKGRKDYEERKASKLGFASLYAYFEDKVLKQKKTDENNKKGEIKLWISKESHLPVIIEQNANFGEITLQLKSVDYEN